MPSPVAAATVIPGVLNFAVVDEGVLMPANQLQTTAVPVEAPVVIAPRPVRPYTPVYYPPKQDRN